MWIITLIHGQTMLIHSFITKFQQNHNITLPYWVNPTILAQLQKITFFLKLARYHDQISHKVAAGNDISINCIPKIN